MGQLGIFIHFLYFSVAGTQMDPDVPIILNFFSFIHFELFKTYFVKVFFFTFVQKLTKLQLSSGTKLRYLELSI